MSETETAGDIRCGVAGWSYPDWDGYVYPPGTKDQLAFISRYVDMIEINSTFYRPPSERNAASWLRRTADRPRFFFTAKLHQDVTHGGVVAPDMVRAFRDGFAPLAGEGKLRHLLAQFRYDFADSPAARGHLRAIRDAFGGIANLTLELRHVSWESPGALEFLKGLGVTVAALDCPLARNSFSLRASGVGAHAYFRLHGRNAAAWFSRDAGRDQTYNYLYAGREVEAVKTRALEIAAMSASLTLVANNHYQGKEVVNALQLKSLLAGDRVPVPALLAERYPELKAIGLN